MEQTIFTAKQLQKKYKHQMAVSNVSFTLERGRIYGLIGENGAGKTTLIRMISGLIRTSGGEMEIMGKSGERELVQARKKISALVENPAIVRNYTGKDNIKFLMQLYGITESDLPERLLTKVGLDPSDVKKAKHYSLGMRQRLGIAMCLVGEPELLVLDEPINGLDPLGIREIRDLLKQLCNEGKTILISSHILSEMQELATDYIMMSRGSIVDVISADQLLSKCEQLLLIRSLDDDKTFKTLKEMGYAEVERREDQIILHGDYDTTAVARRLMEERVVVTEFYCKGTSVEDYYISRIGGEKHE